MLKKIVALFLAGISILAVSCSSGSTTPETEQISAFDQAKLYATINCTTDTSGSNNQYVWAYFKNSNDEACQLKDGSVKYNSISLAFSENDKGYYSQANNLFSSSFSDSLTVNISGVVNKTFYSRPSGYMMHNATIDSVDTETLRLKWDAIPGFSNQYHSLKVKFTNLKSGMDTTITISSAVVPAHAVEMERSSLSGITDSTGTGRFMVTFTHHQKIVVGAPYATGSEIHANFVMNRKLRISAIPK